MKSSFIHIVLHVEFRFVLGGADDDDTEVKQEGDTKTSGMITPYCCKLCLVQVSCWPG